MSILSLDNIAQTFGDFDAFRGISGTIPNDGKVGLVGPNGIGKTTLLLIIAGKATPAAGRIYQAKGIRLGYLPQEAARAFAGQEHSVYAELLTVFDWLREDERRLRQLEQAIAMGSPSAELLEQYSILQESFTLAGGYEYELRIKQVLSGLGFAEDHWQLPLPHLSGGQKTRVLLARLLLEKPDLLVLDEPTNHLDVEAVEWLEGTLRIWEGAILIVSHDRYFLDRVVGNIWEMNRTGVQAYRGNYTAYVQQRQERWQKLHQVYEDFQAHVAKEMDYIRRNISGQRTQMAQGKLSRLAREVAAVTVNGLDVLGVLKSKGWAYVKRELGVSRIASTVGELHQQIGELQPPRRPSLLNMDLRANQRSGNLVLRTRDLEAGYPGTSLFVAEDIELRRTECAALIGANGTGKSTFLKTIMGELTPLQGEIVLGASLEIGYFAQAHDGLNLENSVLDELLSYRNMGLGEARSYLARYLFRQDEVYKPIRTLSGGERGRLALALLSLQGANFLLLDEPTNHLDIPAQETLQEAMQMFSGTILMVSHDRYLVDRLASQVWELKDGRLRVYPGNYQNFLAVRAAAAQDAAEAARVAAAKAAEAARKQAGANGEERSLSKNEQRRMAEALHKIEKDIEAKDAQLQQITADLQQATEGQSFDKIQSLSQAYAAVETELAALMDKWEHLAHE